jgi:hypothetical protein
MIMSISEDMKAVSHAVGLIGKLSKRARQWLTWRIVDEAEKAGLSLRPPVAKGKVT